MMTQKVFLIHGWSVTETSTYQALHLKLAANGYDLQEIDLARFVSLDDRVELADIAHAMQKEMLGRLGEPPWTTPFHVVCHSTGAPVVKEWVSRWYVGPCCENKPFRNVVFLAGAHFGSRLAHHGRSMLAHAWYFGDTGERLLAALELGSEFSWESNGRWLDEAAWKAKGLRPYCLIGDRVKRSPFQAKIFPAGFEKGSDMVVRAAAGNLNFRRFTIDGTASDLKLEGQIEGIPFAALADFVHSGPDHGIMNSIKKSATPSKHVSLRLILQCLGVTDSEEYEQVRKEFCEVTANTRKKRQGFAQLDFRFRSDNGLPINDYRFELGAVVNERDKPSKTVVHTHKNRITPNHFTAFLSFKEFEPELVYFMNLQASAGTGLLSYKPEPFRVEVSGDRLLELISKDQVTQIDVRLARETHKNLFVFHRGTDQHLHVGWNRDGEITDDGISPK